MKATPAIIELWRDKLLDATEAVVPEAHAQAIQEVNAVYDAAMEGIALRATLDKIMGDIARKDILPAHKCVLIALLLNPMGLTTPDLQKTVGIKPNNRRQLQRVRDWLIHTGDISGHVIRGRRGIIKLYRREK
jgi:hypothetical protein